MLSVPFENLDIGLGSKIVCDSDAFIHKIVDRRRGGFCYELNGAFAVLLGELGFKVTLLSARVGRDDGTQGPEFDHLALRVDLDEPWLADVGFGDSFVEPLRMQTQIEQPQNPDTYRITDTNGYLCLERSGPDGGWKREYFFTLTPRELKDFSAMCHHHQTSPESPFTHKRICSRATKDGRVTLADRRLIVAKNQRRKETLLESETEWRAALKKHFSIVLEDASCNRQTKKRAAVRHRRS
jgi:N-hydroxyarylamine O-acetyltransferase